MIRLFAAYALLFAVAFTVAVFSASALGQSGQGDIIAYFASRQTSNHVRLMDVSRRLSIPLTAASPLFGKLLMPNADGGLVIGMTDGSLWELTIWDGSRSIERLEAEQANFRSLMPVWSSGGLLAYQNCNDDVCDIFLWDGDSVRNLTNTPDISESGQAWSVDGRLAFEGCNSNNDLFTCEVYLWDGSTVLNLTASPTVAESTPIWSSDGRLAIHACAAEACDMLVWADGILTNISGYSELNESSAVWSPDGRLAMRTCPRSFICDIMVWDGSTLNNISSGQSLDEIQPAWSVDGRLAYATCELIPMCDIIVRDGDERLNLTRSSAYSEYAPLWSPAGMLIFTLSDSVQLDIMLWDGDTLRNLTQTPQRNEIIMQRDGERWLIRSCDNGNLNCELLLWDGQTLQQLTRTPQWSEFVAVWLP